MDLQSAHQPNPDPPRQKLDMQGFIREFYLSSREGTEEANRDQQPLVDAFSRALIQRYGCYAQERRLCCAKFDYDFKPTDYRIQREESGDLLVSALLWPIAIPKLSPTLEFFYLPPARFIHRDLHIGMFRDRPEVFMNELAIVVTKRYSSEEAQGERMLPPSDHLYKAGATVIMPPNTFNEAAQHLLEEFNNAAYDADGCLDLTEFSKKCRCYLGMRIARAVQTTLAADAQCHTATIFSIQPRADTNCLSSFIVRYTLGEAKLRRHLLVEAQGPSVSLRELNGSRI